ncbi:hypothetical protein [Rhizobium tubonense]|uniref:Glutelin n=1 Tax=Rhizobium tubonense TaxID=484088 RepID=A0A2W4C3H8_9HYPH|nr:hypothetical protein [Rhizobium tubonense]PZM08047.1 hypothetical protein CPY51_30330 [Rhizobium tubonense]
MTEKTFVIICALGVLVLAPASSRATGFECPQLNDLHTPPLAMEIENVLPKGLLLEQPNELSSAITLLREHKMSTDNTINHIVTLYCPAIASDASLSDYEKADRMRQFARRATSLALSMNREQDIIYDVPLNANLAEAAKVEAEKSGLTVEEWIAKTVDDAIP